MPRSGKATSRRIADAAYELFYKEGFAHVGVDAIAEAAGITKRTLYYHFASKDALVATVLELQHELVLKRIQRWTERVRGDSAAIIASVFAEFASWSRKPGWRGSGFTRAAMEFARSPGHPARVAARRNKAAVERWFEEQFADDGIESSKALARQVVLLIEGCNTLILVHGDPTYADDAATAAGHLVEKYCLHRTSSPPAATPGESRRPTTPRRKRSHSGRLGRLHEGARALDDPG